jgi:hypothetical protein
VLDLEQIATEEIQPQLNRIAVGIARAGGRNGWTLEWTTEGRAAGGVTGQALTKTIEETFGAISITGAVDNPALSKMWKPILLRGPKSG